MTEMEFSIWNIINSLNISKIYKFVTYNMTLKEFNMVYLLEEDLKEILMDLVSKLDSPPLEFTISKFHKNLSELLLSKYKIMYLPEDFITKFL